MNGASNDNYARLLPDELTVYFSSDRLGTDDIFSATRASRNDAFGTPVAVPGVNTTTASEAWPTVTADGLTMFLQSNAAGPAGYYQIYSTHRATTADAFPTPGPSGFTAGASQIRAPFVLPDGSAVYYSTDQTLSGLLGIRRVARASDGTFGTSMEVAGLTSNSYNGGSAVTQDELVIYFGSSRTDAAAKGSNDIWVATRASRNVAFDTPKIVPELNTPDIDNPDWLSPDRCRLYLTRTASRQDKIYVASRSM